MMQNCHTQFNNGTTCNTPYVRVVSLAGIVEHYNQFGRRIDYCSGCGAYLITAECAVPAEIPGLTLSAPAFEFGSSEWFDAQPEQPF